MSTPTARQFELAELHEARAIVAGRDECTCGLCKRVRNYMDSVRMSRHAFDGPSVRPCASCSVYTPCEELVDTSELAGLVTPCCAHCAAEIQADDFDPRLSAAGF